MRVKTLREHRNTYGVDTGDAKVTKPVGKEYDLPESMGKTLIGAGLVEEVKEKPAKPEKQPAA
jgi:hypothetical protein